MELLVEVVDHGPNIDHIKVGEVTTIQPDGWQWSEAERTNQNWRIIRAPILSTHANTLMKHHTPMHQRVNGIKYPRTSHVIDLDALPDPTKFKGARGHVVIELGNGPLVAASKKRL